MSKGKYIPLTNRSVIRISGSDAQTFLQGILSQDILEANKTQAIYALILTPQGKFLFDLFITRFHDSYLIDCTRERLPSLLSRLKMYKLRLDVTLEDVSDTYESVAIFGNHLFDVIGSKKEGATKPYCKGIAYIDPRSSKLHGRTLIERENDYQALHAHDLELCSFDEYERQRIRSGIPCGESDLQPEKSFPLEYGLDQIHAISYTKGCYVGQEVTARTHHRGVVRKGLYHVQSDDNTTLPDAGSIITSHEGEKLGVLRSSLQNQGLALLRKENVANAHNQATILDSDGTAISLQLTPIT